MHSIIDEIAEAEKQAEEIRQQAAAQARESISFAQADAATALSDAEIAERDKTRAALLQAEQDGDALAQTILSDMAKEADELCARARERSAEAVSYLVKKVTEAT